MKVIGNLDKNRFSAVVGYKLGCGEDKWEVGRWRQFMYIILSLSLLVQAREEVGY